MTARRSADWNVVALSGAVCAGSALAHVGTAGMPFQIGAVIDRARITAAQAGVFGSLEVGTLALSMVVVAPWIRRLTPMAVALAGCVLTLAGNAGLWLSGGYALQLAFGVLAGAGYGLVFAATIAGGVGADEPDRFYAIGNSASLLIVFGVLSAIPVVGRTLGPGATFACMGALVVVATPFMLGFRRRSGGASELAAQTDAAPTRVRGAPGLLFAWVAFAMGTQGVYAFSERIGRLHHLPEASITSALSVGLFVGLLGTGVAVVLGSRLNRKLALSAGLVGAALSCLLLGDASSVVVFYAGVFTYWIFYMFLYSYILGTAAKLDPSGRLGAFGGGLERLGFALGVWLAGLLSEHASYGVTGLMGAAACVVGLVVGMPSVFRSLDALRPRAADPAAA